MMSTKSTEMDNQQLQSLIEGNKRWLETRRKDPGMYPFKPLKGYIWYSFQPIIYNASQLFCTVISRAFSTAFFQQVLEVVVK